MATIQPPSTGAERRTPDHLRPLDIVLIALEETACPWCQCWLRLLKAHLEAEIPATGMEVLN